MSDVRDGPYGKDGPTGRTSRGETRTLGEEDVETFWSPSDRGYEGDRGSKRGGSVYRIVISEKGVTRSRETPPSHRRGRGTGGRDSYWVVCPVDTNYRISELTSLLTPQVSSLVPSPSSFLRWGVLILGLLNPFGRVLSTIVSLINHLRQFVKLVLCTMYLRFIIIIFHSSRDYTV